MSRAGRKEVRRKRVVEELLSFRIEGVVAEIEWARRLFAAWLLDSGTFGVVSCSALTNEPSSFFSYA